MAVAGKSLRMHAQPAPVSLVYPAWRTRLLVGLTLITALGLVVTLYLALFYAGTDATQGHVQRILYIHVGAFSGASVAFAVTVVGGIGFLRTRNPKWDRLALSGVEIGLPLATITLVTGMSWARPIWNTWWTGDPRLNSMAVMWLMYGAYLTLRAAIEDPDRRGRFAAVFGILCFVSVIYVYSVTRTRTDTLHPCLRGPCPGGEAVQGQPSMTPEMGMTMGIGSLWWCVAAATLVWHRVRLENVAAWARALKARVMGL